MPQDDNQSKNIIYFLFLPETVYVGDSFVEDLKLCYLHNAVNIEDLKIFNKEFDTDSFRVYIKYIELGKPTSTVIIGNAKPFYVETRELAI